MPLRQLFPDAGSADTAKVDIIAVHGLNPRSKSDTAHAWDTWRTPAGPDGRLWLRDDLPQHLPDARIFLYEYNATAVYGHDRDTFVGKANELLEAIRIERHDVKARPIFFFGHSMGGLLVKQALINAHNHPMYTQISRATGGLVFFATPHNGGDWKLVSLGKLTSKIATTAGFQKGDDVLEALKSGSMFSDLMEEHWRHQLLEYNIVSFWGGLDNIVPRESARLGLPGDRENVVKLNADHSGVCKFGTEQTDQDNLKLARANIKDLYRAALKTVELTALSSTVGRDALGPDDQLAERFSRLQADRGPPQGSNGPKLPQHHLPMMRNRKFTGRSAIIEDIQQNLFTKQECQKLAIVGLGGVGKTQVALQLAYRVKEKHPDYSIFWVPVLSHAGFEKAYLEIGKKLSVPMNIDEEDPKESVRRYLSSDEAGRWLLIVDNADDMEMVLGSNDGTESIDQYLPESENGLTLFTTRSIKVGLSVAGSNVVELHEMDQSEAIGLLEKSLLRKQLIQDEAIVVELLQRLERLPLAITQAAAYLNRNRQVTVRRYLELLRSTERDMVGLMSREFKDATRYRESRNAVITTWFVTFDQIQNMDKAAADLLAFLSCIEPKAIPRSLLPDTKSAETENAIDTLCGYAFLAIREDEELYDMHSLVHLATKVWVSKAARTEETTVQALRHFESIFPSSDRANRLVWQAYLPHALRLLDGSEAYRVSERFNLFYKVGRCLDKERRFKDVVRCYEEVVAWRRVTLSETDVDRLASEHALARAYLDDKRVPEATKILEHVVAVQKKTLDESNYSRLASEHELARAYLDDKRVPEATEILEHVVAVQKETLDETDPSRLASQRTLALAHIKYSHQIRDTVEAVNGDQLEGDDTDCESLVDTIFDSAPSIGTSTSSVQMDGFRVGITLLTNALLDDSELHGLLVSAHRRAQHPKFIRKVSKVLIELGKSLQNEKEELSQTRLPKFVIRYAADVATGLWDGLSNNTQGTLDLQDLGLNPIQERRMENWVIDQLSFRHGKSKCIGPIEHSDDTPHSEPSLAGPVEETSRSLPVGNQDDGNSDSSGDDSEADIPANEDTSAGEGIPVDEYFQGNGFQTQIQASKDLMLASNAMSQLRRSLRHWLHPENQARVDLALEAVSSTAPARHNNDFSLSTNAARPPADPEQQCCEDESLLEIQSWSGVGDNGSRPSLGSDIGESRPFLDSDISGVQVRSRFSVFARRRRFPVLSAKAQELRLKFLEYMLPSMPMFVDSIFEPFPYCFETPIRPGTTRIRWECGCGKRLFDDIVELEPGAADQLQHDLEQLGSTVPSEDDNQGQSAAPKPLRSTLNTCSSAVARAWNQVSKLFGKGQGFANRESMLRSARAPMSGTHTPSQNNQATLPIVDTGSSNAPLLLLCVGSKGSAARLHHISLKDIDHDSNLFDLLRDRYGRCRGFKSWFTLRGFKTMHLTKFEVDDNSMSSILHHGECCHTGCGCLPPKDMVGPLKAYQCGPAPERPPYTFPALPSVLLSHYFRQRHIFKKSQAKVFHQIPKRLSGELELTLPDALTECGWGIYIEEGWHWLTIKLLVGLIFFVGSLLFGVIWAATKGDIQSGFSITSAWIAVGAMLLAYMALRDH